MEFLRDLAHRLARTESIALIVALVLVTTGYVDSLEEGVALGTMVAGFVLSRGIAKAGQGPVELANRFYR